MLDQILVGYSLTPCSKFSQEYNAPPGLMQMVSAMKASGAGAVVLSCSDPRLNPYQILGIDSTLSKSPSGTTFPVLLLL